jgi:TonB-linked SusC/RagA family outer membrane protein
MKNKYRGYYVLPLSFALFWALSTPLTSQNGSPPISGIVTDANGPLGGVNIIVKNTSRGTQSDMDGHYEIVTKSSDTLVFSYLGYKAQEVAVGSGSILNVTMLPDATALDAVVINAGYYKVSDREKTGSISRVTAKEIENQPVDNALASLQGRVAGVEISQLTGISGGGYNVRIRGQNSIVAGNEPLYVIDGVPYNSSSMSSRDVSGGILPGGNQSPLSLINPSNIESIEVLKDADATAIYGSRGANGVILITTKKGKAGKTKYAVQATTGVGRVNSGLKLLNTQQYLQMREEAFINDGIKEYPITAYDVNGTWDKNRYTNWQDALLGETAWLQSFEATISGGGNNNSFLVTGGHNRQTTVFPGDAKYNRTTFNAQYSKQSDDGRFDLNFTAGYSIENNLLPGGDLTFQAITLPPNAPALYDANGNLNWENSTFNNPLAALNTEYSTERHSLISNLQLAYRLFKNLRLKANLGYQDSRQNEYQTTPNTIYDPAYGLDSRYSSIYTTDGTRNSWLIEPQLDWNKEVGNSKLQVLVGATFQKDDAYQLLQYADGFPSNNLLHNLAAATYRQVLNDSETEYRYQAVFGRINYSLYHKYLLNLTGRRDGSSRFGPGNKFANFGALGVGWIFSEEAFLKNTIISFGKLRASYGTTGNDRIGDYQYLDTYSVTGNPYNEAIGLTPTQLYNPNFGWELNKKAEIALETGFLKDRVRFDASYYYNTSSNQLVGVKLPATTGFSIIQANLDAKVENKGWEFVLITENIVNPNFDWSTSINLTIPRNKLVEFPGLEQSTYANQFVIGQPLSIRKLYKFTGVDPDSGLYQFEDYNGDGVISAPEDKQFVVDTSPKFYGGLKNNLRLGNWQLDFLFQFTKQKGVNYWANGSPAGIMVNQPVEILDHWQQQGDAAPFQLYTSGSNPEATTAFYNFTQSDRSISDASFIKLKNVTLSYTLPYEGSTFKIFLSGQNLATITPYDGIDPEQPSRFLPPLRWISGGVQISL